MKKLFFSLFLLLLAAPVFADDVGYYTRVSCASLTPVANSTVCLQTTTTGGLNAGVIYVWDGSAWIDVTGSAGSGHQIQDEGSPLTQRSALNFVGGGVTVTDIASVTTVTIPTNPTAGHEIQDEGNPLTQRAALNFVGAGVAVTDVGSVTTVTIGAGAAAIAVTFTPNGSIAATDVQTAIQEVRDEAQPLDADLTALAANSTAGFWAAATNAARSFADGTGIAWTNPAGVAGNPTANVTSTVAMTDRAATFGNFDYDFGGAASLGLPRQTGAAPTTPGRVAFDLTSQTAKMGLTNGSTVTFATTGLLGSYQPLHANLTGISSLSLANNQTFVYHGGQMTAVTKAGGANCNGAGQAITWDATAGAEGCVTFSLSGLSGGTAGKYTIATGATTFETTSSLISNSAGNVHLDGGLEVNCSGATCISIDSSAWAGHLPATWTAPYTSTASPKLSFWCGAITAGHIIVPDANGCFVDGGVAGAGTTTANNTQTFTEKTLDVEASGNVITTVQKIWLPAAGGTVAVPGLLWDTTAGNEPTPVCSNGPTHASFLRCTADFPDSDGDFVLQQTIALPSDWTGAIDLKFKWRTATANAGLNVVWQAAGICVADGEADDPTWSSSSTVIDAGKGTANLLNDATITGLTLTGCAAGELMHLMVLRNRTHGSDTMTGIVSLVGVEVTTRRAQ